MFTRVSSKLLPLLQLMRMALVFTAVADALCTQFLAHAVFHKPIGWDRIGLIAGVSVGLYGFGMSLNDIIDRRRDSLTASHRPLPSGRLGVTAAHVLCGGLCALAAGCGIAYAVKANSWLSVAIVLWTMGLIYFYDVAGKYLVGAGLVSLGLIRFFQCIVPAPQVPVLWHPLLLLNHVTVLSAVAYAWEQKRPTLTATHGWSVLGALFGIDLILIGLVGTLRMRARGHNFIETMNVDRTLLLPAIAAMAFVAVAWAIRRRVGTGREAGQTLMLYGLLWLIVYDAAFAGSYAGWRAAAGVLLLLPLAYGSVQLMRWWSKLAAAAQRPTFQRAEA